MVKSKILKQRRNPSIDFLRGLAILLVLVAHYPLVPEISKGAWIGVDLFFVLSGFLISSLLFSELKENGSVDVKRFLIRRGFKIYPLFYLYIATIVFYFVLFDKSFTNAQLIGELFFLQNYLGSIMAHTWSLAVEEHFYIGISLLLYGASFSKTKNLVSLFPYFCLLVALFCLVLRYTNSTVENYSALTHHYPTHLRIDSMLAGALAGYLYVFKKNKFYYLADQKWLLILAIMTLALPFVFSIESTMINAFGLSILAAAFFIIVVNCINSKRFGIFCEGAVVIRLIGKHSYSIYLWHLAVRNIVYIMMSYFGFEKIGIATGLIYLCATISLGVLLSITVEAQFLKIRDRYFAPRVKQQNF